MAYDYRKSLMKEVEELRGRRLVSLCNFDRLENPPNLGASIHFAEDLKEPVFRVLKETLGSVQKLDLLLYTRGGETNAVWPIACLLREFDADFEVLIPYRAHSSGTLLSLAAKTIVMTPMSELSPIDPTTGNQFNPRDENTKNPLGISVEDVTSYHEFLKRMFGLGSEEKSDPSSFGLMQPHLSMLTSKVHPLALGNVHRVLMQIKVLATSLLNMHYGEGTNIEEMINSLTTRYYSHSHMIHRQEALSILGAEHVTFADSVLSSKLDQLLRSYEDDFALRQPFFLNRFMGDEVEREARLIGGCVESREWGYLYETNLRVRQSVALPPGVQIQLQPGQTLPLVPGMPRSLAYDVLSRCWVRNKMPLGVSI